MCLPSPEETPVMMSAELSGDPEMGIRTEDFVESDK